MKTHLALSDAVHLIQVPIVGTTPVRCTLVRGSERSVLIDTGTAQMAPTILDVLRTVLGSAERLDLLVNTHPHHDHIGANAQIVEACAPLQAASERARPWIEDFDLHYREFCLIAPDVLPDAEWMRRECFDILDGATRLDLTLLEGSTIRLGGPVLTTLELPGHMRSEIGFVEAEARLLVLADAVVNTGIVGEELRIFHGYQDVAAYRSTLTRLGGIVASGVVDNVVTAHLPLSTASEFAGLVETAGAVVDRVEAWIVDRCARPATVEELWHGVCDAWDYRHEFRALGMVMAHLRDLVDRGILVDADGRYAAASGPGSPTGTAFPLPPSTRRARA
jgi:glyoxylase-like metal-dependent hydrolase (beta-lactamase superfamily II)